MKTLALLVIAWGAAVAGESAVPATAALPGRKKPRVVAITAKKFSFDPDVIRLKQGEPVVFQLRSLDRTHGFKIPDLKLRVDVTTGAVVLLPFTPVKEGTFPFECDVFCGVHHEDMNGTLIVGP